MLGSRGTRGKFYQMRTKRVQIGGLTEMFQEIYVLV